VLDLNELVTETQTMLERVIGGNIEFSTALADDLGYISADQGQIEQIVMNLVVNARDAMPDGGKLLLETCNVTRHRPRPSTVYGIVKQSGGHIEVESEPGLGASFRLYFPQVAEQAEAFSPQPPYERSLTGSETVLLVEDEEALRGLGKKILETYGYTVLIAADGDAGPKLARNHAPADRAADDRRADAESERDRARRTALRPAPGTEGPLHIRLQRRCT
jgi:two-component system, cell cycle sensor histidine kinase and response regulator CckA